jgi:ABC-2 type transport system permease protein
VRKFLAIFTKDALLMLRDWPGLAILFIMPAVLLIIITFTQESTIPSKKSGMRIGIADDDSSGFGQALITDLVSGNWFNFVILGSGAEAQEAVREGECQMAVIISDNATERLFSILDRDSADSSAAEVVFLYDPGMQRIFRDAVQMSVTTLIQLTAIKILMLEYTGEVNRSIREHSDELNSRLAGTDFMKGIPAFPYRDDIARKIREEMAKINTGGPEIMLPLSPSFSEELVKVREEAAFAKSSEFMPGVLQNNIPAFTLFAMFFVVIPLAGSIINEKTHGTFDRMRTLPVTFLQVSAAKVMLFVAICTLQFIFLLFIGKYVMPLFGEESTFDMHVNMPALAAAVLSSSLAATGFGILTGAFASTHGQAATFGSVMVVILALLGGIFVPVHVLPEVLRNISYISPLRWGTDAFLGVFARHSGITGILTEVTLLTGFFILSVLLSISKFRKR